MLLRSCQEPVDGVSVRVCACRLLRNAPLWVQVRLAWLNEGPQETGTRTPQELPYILLQPLLVDAQRLLLRLWIQKYEHAHFFPTCAHKQVTMAAPGAISTPKPSLNCRFISLFAEQGTITAQEVASNYTWTWLISHLGWWGLVMNDDF